MSSFADALEAQRSETGCGVCRALRTLDATDADRLREALADKRSWTGQGIANALSDAEVYVTDRAVQRHRQGRGSCGAV